MYLCYKVAVLANELFRLKKKRKGEKTKKEQKRNKKEEINELLFKSILGVNTSSMPSHWP